MDTTRKAISLQELCTDYLKAVCPKCGRWDFLRRARNLITFPRDLEDVLGPMVDAQHGSGLRARKRTHCAAPRQVDVEALKLLIPWSLSPF